MRTESVTFRNTKIECQITGSGKFPILFAGGVVYDQLLIEIANQLNATIIIPKFPYWQGESVENLEQLTLEQLLEDLDVVVEKLIGKDQQFAVIGGSRPAWIACELSKRHDNCHGLIMLAAEPPRFSNDEKEKKTEEYLKENDSRPEEEQEKPLFTIFSPAKLPKGEKIVLNDKYYQPGIRQQLLDNEKEVPQGIPANEVPLQYYRMQNGPKFWKNPACEDSSVWKGAKIDPDFMGYFFMNIIPDNHSYTLPTDKCVLIMPGLFDFTFPHYLWDDYLKSLKKEQGTTLPKLELFILEEAGHLAIVTQNSAKQFVPNQQIIEKMNGFIKEISQHSFPELRSRL